MKSLIAGSRLPFTLMAAMLGAVAFPNGAQAVTTVFFDISQHTNIIASGTTSDTISSEGYLFTVTRDKLFTGGVGLTNPIGRSIRIPWPEGLEAQAVTTGPVLSGATITVKRQDGQTFAIQSFTAKLLANTGGAGGALEIMPLLNGNDGFSDPLACDMTGTAGQNFSFTTPQLTGFDTYDMSLYVDYALMSLTVVDASPPPPLLDIFQGGGGIVQISWPSEATGYSLESITAFPGSGWSPVTNNVVNNGGFFTVDIEAVGAAQFFRLRK